MPSPLRVGLMTGGGDCPGLNAVIRAIVKRALSENCEVIGIEDAFRGLLDPGRNGTSLLTLDSISGILPRGGTILGTSNRANPYRYPVKEGGMVVERDLSDLAVERLKNLGVEGLIVAGGDGSLQIARRLAEEKGLKVVGVPKTIDNDLAGSDQTFGFDTARSIATDAVDKLHTTAEAHDRVMILEVMGRNAGFIALESGLAGGADVILIPEIPYRVDAVLDKIRQRQARGRSFSIIVVAEGARPEGGQVAVEESAAAIPGRGVVRLGGAGKQLADLIASKIELEVRVTVLGHLQRGGGPSPFDRVLASRMGAHAWTLARQGRWGRMVSLQGNRITDIAITPEATADKKVDVHGELCEVARQLCICLGE